MSDAELPTDRRQSASLVQMEDLGGRARRALALMGVALAALATAAGLYLRATARPPAPPPPTFVTSLDWLSSSRGWVVLADEQHRSVLFHTADGGRTWSRQFATVESQVTVSFLDERHGLMTEPTPFPGSNPSLLRSDDGGEHWSPIPLPFEIGARPYLPYFLDLDHGWVMVRTGRSDTAEDVDIYRTEDGGLNWTLILSVDPITWTNRGLAEQGLKRWLWFRTPRDGWLGTLEPDGTASVSVTHDGGESWRPVPLPAPPGGWVRGDTLTLVPPRVSGGGDGALMLVDANRLGGGRSGRSLRGPSLPVVIVYRTTDGGENWTDPRLVPTAVTPNLGDPAFLAGASFVDGSAGWLSGGTSAWTTADSGRTWIRGARLPGGRLLAGLAPVDGDVAVGQGAASAVAGAPWGLYVTEDAGRTWRELPSPKL